MTKRAPSPPSQRAGPASPLPRMPTITAAETLSFTPGAVNCP